MTIANTYPLKTGEEDRARLSIQEDLLNPTSMEWIAPRLFEGCQVMDVGCGHGRLTALIAKVVGETGHVFGVDINQNQLDIAKEHADGLGLKNITFIQKDVYDLHTLQGVVPLVDVVHCRYLLIHLKEPIAAVEEMKGRINPDGILLLEEIGALDYTCTPHTPLSFYLWNQFAYMQHLMAGSDRFVGKRLLNECPKALNMRITHHIATVENRTALEKSRFRIGMESFLTSSSLLLRWLGSFLTEGLREMENDPSVIITQRILYQITATPLHLLNEDEPSDETFTDFLGDDNVLLSDSSETDHFLCANKRWDEP